MQAKKDAIYAILNEKGEIMQTLAGEDFAEWDENSIHLEELPKDFKWLFRKAYKFENGEWNEPTIEQKRELMLDNFANWAQAEIQYITDQNTPYGEQDTWAVQYDEAFALLNGQKTADELILLPILAAERGESLDDLALKVLQKNKAYNEKIARIIAQRQMLAKQTESAKAVNLEFIQWERIYLPPEQAAAADKMETAKRIETKDEQD